MTSRMRKSRRFRCRTVIFYLCAGFLLNLVVTYSCWFRIGFVEFGFDSIYWQIDHADAIGYHQNGHRFGVHGRAQSISTFEPSPLSFSYNALLNDDVVERDTTIVNTWELGVSFGWPFFCVSASDFERKTRFVDTDMNMATTDKIKWTTVDITPQPKWYYGGVRTGSKSWPFNSIPIAVRPLGLIANTIIYALFVLGIYHS
jgi:hypothetical protein